MPILNINKEIVPKGIMDREIKSILNWYQWLERWNEALTVQEMIGLLHCGFEVSLSKMGYNEKEYSQIDRVAFYLTAANGWADTSILEKPEEKRLYPSGDRDLAKSRQL